jgi:predicted transcriptional regulator
MGQVPVFSCQLMTPKRNNQTMWRKFFSCTATKLGMSFKNDDFVIPDFEIGCFADPSTGNVQQFAFSE